MAGIGKPLSQNTRDNEQNKFCENDQGEVAVRVCGDVNIAGDLIFGIDYNKIDVTYPNDTTEIITYTLNTATIRTLEVIYTDSTKCNLESVEII